MIGGICSFLRLEEMGLRFWRFFPEVLVGLCEAGRKPNRNDWDRTGPPFVTKSAQRRAAGGTSADEVGRNHMERFFKDSIHPHQYRKSP